MMGIGWQDITAGLLALAALVWLVLRRVRAARRPTPLCGDCPMCEAGNVATAPPARSNDLIPASELTRRDG
jgi:hypothetical protein